MVVRHASDGILFATQPLQSFSSCPKHGKRKSRRRESFMLELIATPGAPGAVGPYSQAVRAGDFVYVSGQLPLDPASGKLLTGALAPQTRRVLRNLETIVQAVGGTLNDVVKTTVYMSNLAHFAEMNEAYQECFGEHKPARATVEVARLPKDAGVEIDAVAYLPRGN
jgi:2-iminobutanoate/2-iminopropanoate deaminase